MTVTPSDEAGIDAELSRSRDPRWETRRDAARELGQSSGKRAQDRLVELLADPENLVVIETAAHGLALDPTGRGLSRIAAVFDDLDDQAAAYVAVTVSDALGDAVFVRLLEVIRNATDDRVAAGARHLGGQIGMPTSPEWQQALAVRPPGSSPAQP